VLERLRMLTGPALVVPLGNLGLGKAGRVPKRRLRGHPEARRDLLAAFSPLDHPTTATLTAQELTGAFERLMQRLVVLAALHGPGAAGTFLAALADPGDGADIVDVVAAFLERGAGDSAAGPSEIQQELVHFSRIVDIGHLGLNAGVDEHALRRLRGSSRLPDSLKVLSELLVVTRARLAQRGLLLPVPWIRPGPAAEADSPADLTTAVPAGNPDYWMAVRCGRRRIRRQFRHELSALLGYLTPAEAGLALWAHASEQQLPLDVQLAVVQADACHGITAVQWRYQPGICPAGEDVIARVARRLPTISRLPPGDTALIEMGPASYRVHAADRRSATVTETQTGTQAAGLTAPDLAARALSPADLAGRAHDLLAAYTGPDLASMEAGHIHLDRDLDVDQDTGTAIGAALLPMLASRQRRPPLLTPMMDDDHVLVRLAPATYRAFLGRTFGAAPMHLICESSPIIRAIVVELFRRMNNSPLAGRYQRRGGNLFLPLGDGSHCELFEGIDGSTPITGCVFFEVALLTYRCDPGRFDQYFTDRYHLRESVHDHAAAILSASQPHDARAAELGRYYATFADVTSPNHADLGITALVSEVLKRAAPVTAHLNVLEDYYEVQQHRVRELLRILGLPLRLVTIHFNAITGRVVCHD
jgi:hypothetical protein